MVEFQLSVRTPRAVTAATFTDFDHDGTRHHVTTRRVFRIRGITLHEALAVFVQQITTFTTAAFCYQNARTGDAGWVELPHFHILHRHASADSHTNTVTSIDVGIGGGLINTASTAGRQHGRTGFEVNYLTGFNTQRGTTDNRAIGIFTRSSAYHSEKMVVWFFRFC